MGMGFFLVFGATAALLGCCVLARGEQIRNIAAHLLTLAPAALIVLVVTGADSSSKPERWRVTLDGYRFQLAGDERIRVGGDAKTDDLYVPRLGAGLVSIGRSKGDEITITTSRDPRHSLSGLAIFRRDHELSPECASSVDPTWGGICIPEGSRFCVKRGGVDRCDAPGTTLSWSTEAGMARLTDGAQRALCSLPLRERRESGDPEIFPLADYARPGCGKDAVSPWAVPGNIPAPDSFYWRDGNLYLLPAPGTSYLVDKSGGRQDVYEPQALKLRVGEAVNLYLHRYERRQRMPTRENPVARESWIKDVRSVRVHHVSSSSRGPIVEVTLHTRESRTIEVGGASMVAITSRASNPATLANEATLVGFDTLGERTAAQLLNVIKLERAGQNPLAHMDEGDLGSCFKDAPTLVIRGIKQVSCAPLGRWFSIGDPDQVQAKVRIVRLQVPHTWVAAICIVAMISLLARSALQLPVAARVVLVFLEMMLALRVLVSFESAGVDWKQEGTVAAAWLALLCIPLTFELFARSPAPTRVAVLVRVAKVTVVIAAVAMIVSAIGFANFALVDWPRILEHDMAAVVVVLALLCVALAVLTRRPARLLEKLRAGYPWLESPTGAIAPLVAIAVVHSAMALAGIKEQLFGLRICAFLVPLLVLAWGYWYSVIARTQSSDIKTILSGIAAVFLPMVGFILAKDNGALIYFLAAAIFLLPLAWPFIARHWLQSLLVFGAMFALCMTALALRGVSFASLYTLAAVVLVVVIVLGDWLRRRGRLKIDARSLWAAPVGFAVAAVLALHVSGMLLNAGTPTTTQRVTISDLERVVNVKTNLIRLIDLISPRMVEDLGLRQGYEQRMAMAEMRSFAATVYGHGWPHSFRPGELRKTHVDDTVAAVHLIAPFGRIGAAGVGVFLIVFAASVAAILQGRADAGAQQARLAAVVIVFVSLYMVFANIGVLPFTGRNFYLLSVASSSDLLEGGLLLAIAFAGLMGRWGETH